MFLVVVNGILFLEPSKLLKGLKIIILLYVLVNIISCLTIRAAIDPEFGTWRGIEEQKNGLAQNGIFCLLISLMFFNSHNSFFKKSINYFLVIMSIILVVMAGSSTILLLLGFIFIFALVFTLEKFFQPVGMGKFFIGLIYFFVFSLLIVLTIYSSEVFAMIPHLFGKDLTISGRTPFWGFLFDQFFKKPILGYGYGTFWIMGNNPIIDAFAKEFGGFKINSAHNGYLEIMLQLGIIGIIFFLITLAACIYRCVKLKSNVSFLILISIIVINISESTILRLKTLTTLVFITLYVAGSFYYFKRKKNLL